MPKKSTQSKLMLHIWTLTDGQFVKILRLISWMQPVPMECLPPEFCPHKTPFAQRRPDGPGEAKRLARH